MGAREPGGGERMGLVDMDEIEAARGEQLANFPGSEEARSAVGDLMDADAGFGASSGQGGTACREQLGGVPAFVEAFEQQEELVLTAAPFRFEIGEQRNHGAPARRARSASMSFPSFEYFLRTVRAAICEIKAPR